MMMYVYRMEDLQALFTVKDLAKILRISPKAVYCRLERGQLSGVRLPGSKSIRFTSKYVKTLIAFAGH